MSTAPSPVKQLLKDIEQEHLSVEEISIAVTDLLSKDLSHEKPADVEVLGEKISQYNLFDLEMDLFHHKDVQYNKLILSEMEAMQKGTYFPTSNPYSEKQALELLQTGVEHGLYTQKELNDTMTTMKASKTYQKLRTLHEEIFQRDHTPFGSNKEHLNDYGAHLFVGRRVSSDKTEHFATLDYSGVTGYSGLNQAYHTICDAVKKERTILLSKSPGNDEVTTYEPFRPKEMQELQRRFEADPEMEGYTNPFEYQPT